MSDLLELMGGYAPDVRSVAELPVLMRRLQAGDTLFREGAEALAIYFVRTGSIKTYHVAEDGWEHVLAFSGRAEVLGFDAVSSGIHPTAAVALEDSSVYVLPLFDFHTQARSITALDLMVQLAVSRALASQWDIADVLAPVAAEVRLARFLMRLSQRMASYGQSPRRFSLRMTRRDIASYLGVASETISRSFGVLVELGLVAVAIHEVEILDLDGLMSFSLNTRRHTDETGRPFESSSASQRWPVGSVRSVTAHCRETYSDLDAVAVPLNPHFR
jgi:CRP/FNR family transcriptional regulator